MTYRGGSPWLQTVPPEARREIRRIVDGLEGKDFSHRRTAFFYRWAVRLTPSVGTPTDVVLIARTDEHELEWQIMESGEVVGPILIFQRRLSVPMPARRRTRFRPGSIHGTSWRSLEVQSGDPI
ncbi:MAG TPA: hypothetical protein VK701_01255 [Solirubrobacteraceae bacterium]|jgi:hypothetical protein|nr:hypothetical protein [Solirubrobacteraceae bacterium]